MAGKRAMRLAVLMGGTLLLAACGDGQGPAFLQKFRGGGEDGEAAAAAAPATATRLVERDVEAPEVFQKTETGLWDGRPSLGGVWVAYPDVKEPERVVIRNEANKKFVIGALFRRERETPGPKFQISSDAAEALGLLAGQPAPINVTALRREEAPAGGAGPVALPAAETIETASLDGDKTDKAAAPAAPAPSAKPAKPAPVEVAAADAIARATAGAAPAAAAPAKAPAPASSLSKPFIQIGIFSVEQNATNAATSLRRAGILPTVKKQTSKGKTFWRVVVGPSTTSSDRAAILRKVKDLGYTDAYFVSS